MQFRIPERFHAGILELLDLSCDMIKKVMQVYYLINSEASPKLISENISEILWKDWSQIASFLHFLILFSDNEDLAEFVPALESALSQVPWVKEDKSAPKKCFIEQFELLIKEEPFSIAILRDGQRFLQKYNTIKNIDVSTDIKSVIRNGDIIWNIWVNTIDISYRDAVWENRNISIFFDREDLERLKAVIDEIEKNDSLRLDLYKHYVSL